MAETSTPPTLPLLLTADDVAAALSMGRRTFDRLVSTGAFPPADVRRGAKLVRWKRETVVAGVEQLAAATRDGD